MSEAEECERVLVPKGGIKKPSKLKKEVCQLRSARTGATTINVTDCGDRHVEWSELDSQVHELLKKLSYFQTRSHNTNAVKHAMRSFFVQAAAKRRLVYGLKEIHQLLRLQRPQIKLVVIASDVERLNGAECELNSLRQGVESLCQLKALPLVHASTRRKLSKLLKKSGRVGAVGIVEYGGAEDIYQRIIELMKREENSQQCQQANNQT